MGKQLLKFISVILFAVIVLNLFTGSLLGFLLSGSEGKCSSHFSDGDEIELIKVPVQGSISVFQKINNHEMIYHKKLYDIVRSFIVNDMQYFYCVNDFKEEKILQRISECTGSHLDYYNSTGGSGQTDYKFFTPENFFFSSSKNELPETAFMFCFMTEKFPLMTWFEKNDPPPEISFC